ncbi:MAG: 30S ribosomal protein S20 [Alphaproteobacteria bacterium]|jgi:small subunit ribosomal protein S20|nr:MAG: 30S ribosomal protein S20 [alpha proteobacterium HIMB59]|tara:strand:+ start:308 stop:574 length:267 start_codon:yes stop_codon:yes gene_type:complete
MPQHKSAKKRLRQTVRKTAVNKSVKSNVATQLKAIDKLIKDKKVDESMAKLKQVMSVLHKSTQRKIMHLNKASRTISKLQKDISAISK